MDEQPRNGGEPPAEPGSRPMPSHAPPLTSKTKLSDDRTFDLERRRDQLNARVAELQWDLGGLAYEMAVRGEIHVDVLIKRARRAAGRRRRARRGRADPQAGGDRDGGSRAPTAARRTAPAPRSAGSAASRCWSRCRRTSAALGPAESRLAGARGPGARRRPQVLRHGRSHCSRHGPRSDQAHARLLRRLRAFAAQSLRRSTGCWRRARSSSSPSGSRSSRSCRRAAASACSRSTRSPRSTTSEQQAARKAAEEAAERARQAGHAVDRAGRGGDGSGLDEDHRGRRRARRRLIVCGTRGRGAIKTALLGSVSTGRAAHSARPVLIEGAALPGPVRGGAGIGDGGVSRSGR